MTSTPLSPRKSLSSQSRRSSSPPRQTFHPSKGPSVPTPSLLGSAAAGAHYSGAKVDHKKEDVARASFASPGPDVDLEGNRKIIWEDLKELYNGRPTVEIFNRSWDPNATFQDPLTRCLGLKEVASEYLSLPKTRSSSITISSRVLSSTSNPNRIIVSLTQQYTIRLLRIKKTIQSMLVIELNDEDFIVKVEDRWDGKELSNSWVANTYRRLNAKLVYWLVKVPKNIIGHSSG